MLIKETSKDKLKSSQASICEHKGAKTTVSVCQVKKSQVLDNEKLVMTVWPALRAGSNVQDISGIFQEYTINYFINQLLLMGKILDGIFICMQLFVLFLFHFLMEYYKNILQVRLRPKQQQ